MMAEWEGIEELRQWVDDMNARCQHPEPPFVQAERRIYESVGANYAAGGRPTWPPRKRSYPHPPLIKTGAMRDSSTGSGRRELRISAAISELELEPTVHYADYQHSGTHNADGSWRIDPRPFFYYQDADIDAICDVFIDFIFR